jgi:glycosyltransferase involved in cell wall biosynthesis
VFVPVDSEEWSLDDLLHRLVATSCNDWEMIVIDGGSTDGTAAILNHWAAEPSVRVLPHPINRGQRPRFAQD